MLGVEAELRAGANRELGGRPAGLGLAGYTPTVLNGKRITVVLPAYNASRTLRRTFEEIPQDIVNATRARYIEVYERLTGTQWNG